MRNFPNSVIGLIELLEHENPSRVRERGESERDHERYAGRVDLIAELRRRYESITKQAKKELPSVLQG